LPGDYRVRLTALGETVEQPLKVQLDYPRLKVSTQELGDYWIQVQQLYSMQCSIDEALTQMKMPSGRSPQLKTGCRIPS
jgi:hypothetical protein